MNLTKFWYFSIFVLFLSCKFQNDIPEISFNKKIDLGVVKVGQSIETKIYLKNISHVEYEIFDIKTSCGCTVAELVERRIRPNDSILLKSIFNAKIEDIGPINQSIVIKDNTSKEFSIIKIKGNVK
jgi:hypothetical protein